MLEEPRSSSAPAPAPGHPVPSNGWLSLLRRGFFELLIVFFGVFAAFQLSEYREGQEEKIHRAQMQRALVQEIEEITIRTRRAATQTPRMIAYYDSSIAAGAMPPLQPLIEPISVRSHMWEAALESGGLNLLDVPTLYRISEFYNALNAGFEQLAQLRHLSETVLIPNLEKGPDEFYDPENATLRPKYQWYLQGLRNVADLAGGITDMGDKLVADLKQETTDE